MGPWDPAPSGPEAPAPEPKRRGSRARLLVVAALILLAGLAWYLSKAQFKIREVSYTDDAVDVVLIEPATRPAPPPAPGTAQGSNGEAPPAPEP